ncbi:MAG: hypothetical protein FJW97_06935 [Actinobacteria bacterium]|nr:hypothetical protein [Actinomycetota bacterium]
MESVKDRGLRATVLRMVVAARQRILSDRGDVPGWVLVAVMTAGLVTAIWLIADDQLTSVLDRAISSVSQP